VKNIDAENLRLMDGTNRRQKPKKLAGHASLSIHHFSLLTKK
jgi:hypothetical protein